MIGEPTRALVALVGAAGGQCPADANATVTRSDK
jgi:hypothetical protein